MKPLLVIDGDSLAHRAYHALPKTIKRAGGRPSGALVGFTNMLTSIAAAYYARTPLLVGSADTVKAAEGRLKGG